MNMTWQDVVTQNNLAVSVINLRDFFSDNPMTRLDSDYFRKDFLEDENSIKTKEWEYLEDISTSVINFGAYSLTNQIEFLEEGVPFLNVGDIKENNILVNGAKRIDAELSTNVLHKSLAKEGQVLLTIAGTIGNAAVAYELPDKTNSNQAIANITLKSNISPFYVSTYLNCKYGKSQTSKLTISSVQPNLLLTQVKLVKVAIPSDKLQGEVERLYREFHKSLKESNKILQDINELLLQNLGFAEFTPSTVNYSSRSSKEPTETGRFDGEYWLPMYDEIEKKIVEYPHGYDAFDKLIEVSSETISPDADETYKYAELSNVIASIGLIEDASELYGNELPSRARMRLRKDDVVLSSVEGSADKVAIVKVENNNLVGSTGFFVLRKKHLLPEVILALLRIPHINAIYKRQAQGTILTAVPRSSLSRVMLPKIPEPYQHEIASQVQEAHKLHNESKRLLEVAKRAVEVFIEQDEDAALEYIRQNYE